jgi:hypothetical protein
MTKRHTTVCRLVEVGRVAKSLQINGYLCCDATSTVRFAATALKGNSVAWQGPWEATFNFRNQPQSGHQLKTMGGGLLTQSGPKQRELIRLSSRRGKLRPFQEYEMAAPQREP